MLFPSAGQCSTPARLSAPGSATAIAAASTFSAAVAAGGVVSPYGSLPILYTQNQYTRVRPEMVPVAGRSGVRAVAASTRHAVALKDDGTIVVWADPTGTTPSSYGWMHTQVPAGARSGVVHVSAAADLSLALTANGSLHVWGPKAYYDPMTWIPGSFKMPENMRTGIVAAAACEFGVLAADKSGALLQWQHIGMLPTPPYDCSNIVDVACGGDTRIAIRADGTLCVWGSSPAASAPVPAGLRLWSANPLKPAAPSPPLSSDFAVRLAGGAGPWEGRLEVRRCRGRRRCQLPLPAAAVAAAAASRG